MLSYLRISFFGLLGIYCLMPFSLHWLQIVLEELASLGRTDNVLLPSCVQRCGALFGSFENHLSSFQTALQVNGSCSWPAQQTVIFLGRNLGSFCSCSFLLSLDRFFSSQYCCLRAKSRVARASSLISERLNSRLVNIITKEQTHTPQHQPLFHLS